MGIHVRPTATVLYGDVGIYSTYQATGRDTQNSP